MKRKMAALAAMLSGCVCASTAYAQDVERTRITTETVSTPSSTLTTQTMDTDYEIDKRRDQGWNAPWGLLFSVNSPFNGSGNVINPFTNLGAAGFFTFSPDMMLRGGFTLTRTLNPVAITKTTLTQGGEEIVTFSPPGGTSAANSLATTTTTVNLSADMLWRLTRNKVAPYAGVGANLSYSLDRFSFDDEATSASNVIGYRRRNTDVTFGLKGIVGAEYRFHSNFALFAEYNLTVNVLRYTVNNNRTTYQDASDNPSAVSSVYNQSNTARWFGASTNLAQQGLFGLMVFF